MTQFSPASLCRTLRVPLGALLLGTLIIFAYYPGLRGPFVFDDSIHIANNPAIRISTLKPAGLFGAGFSDGIEVLRRPLAKISFALNYYFAGDGLDAYSFKLTNLAIHMLNTGLVYWLAVLLMAQLRAVRGRAADSADRWVPALATALWALHPIQLTSVLYVVQRMNSLSALFVLGGSIAYIYGRRSISANTIYSLSLMAAGLLLGLALGVASKENAALLPLFVALIEVIFFKRDDLDKDKQRKLWMFYALSVAFCFLALIWSIASGTIEKSYLGREYTLTERLLTESRIIWHYIGLVIVPDLEKFGLFHDDIALSSGLLTPWTTLPALVSIIVIILTAILLIRRQPIFSFAVLWFLVGHSMESGLIGLEIAHEHRNYLPSAGLILGITYGLHAGFSSYRARLAPAILGIVLIGTMAAVTHLRAQTWSTEESIITQMAYHHPLSARSQYMLGIFKEERLRDPDDALLHYRRAAELAPHEAGYILRMTVTASTIKSELNDVVASHIANSLRREPPSVLIINILQELARCVNQTTVDCRRLHPRITNWYQSLLENPYLSKRSRNDFTVYLFNLSMNRGDYDTALWAAKNGQAHDHDHHAYTLMEANVYISLNRLDKAEEILASTYRWSEPPDAGILTSRDQLLTMLRERRGVRGNRANR